MCHSSGCRAACTRAAGAFRSSQNRQRQSHLTWIHGRPHRLNSRRLICHPDPLPRTLCQSSRRSKREE